jgi:hypothetical protein
VDLGMSRLLGERLSGVGLLGAALLFLAGLSVPAAAPASQVSKMLGLGLGAPAEFRAPASNGYSILVEGAGGRVTLSTNGPAGTAIYVVPGRTSTSHIEADFGKRGRVDVEFIPSRRKKVERPPRGCEGKPHVTRWGVFTGTIRFVGERSYTRFQADEVPGRTHIEPNWRCKRPGSGGSGEKGSADLPVIPGESSEDALVLELSNEGLGLEAGAYAFRAPGEKSLTVFLAAIEERQKRMRVSRYAFEPAEDWTFSFNDALTTATVAPPAPFSGTGSFQRSANGPANWSGSLAVTLPGTAAIPLVGPGYRARLYRLSEDGIATPGP